MAEPVFRIIDRLRQAYLTVAIPVAIVGDGLIYGALDRWRHRDRQQVAADGQDGDGP